MKIITHFSYDASEFEEIVTKHYGHEFSIVASEEGSNYSSKEMNKMEKKELSGYDEIKLKEFRENGDYQYLTRLLLQDLINTDVLPPGNYLFDLSW